MLERCLYILLWILAHQNHVCAQNPGINDNIDVTKSTIYGQTDGRRASATLAPEFPRHPLIRRSRTKRTKPLDGLLRMTPSHTDSLPIRLLVLIYIRVCFFHHYHPALSADTICLGILAGILKNILPWPWHDTLLMEQVSYRDARKYLTSTAPLLRANCQLTDRPTDQPTKWQM